MEPEAKLALTEHLLASVDLAASARFSLEWLSKHARVEQSIVAIRDDYHRRLVGIAEWGVSPTSADVISLDLDDREHFLVLALDKRAPVFFARGSMQWSFLDNRPFFAIPLRPHGKGRVASVGLLLLSTPDTALSSDIRWFSEIFTQQVSRLLSKKSLEDAQLVKERTLLNGIINAVSDPILLTDNDGRLILANALAERLFASKDEASDGWRHAISLNNTLFSAALLRSAIGPQEPVRGELLLVDPSDGSDLLFELMSSAVMLPREGNCLVSILRNVSDLGIATREIEESRRRLRSAEAEIREERHRLDLIIDSVADPILVTDPSGQMVLMNAPAEKLFTSKESASDDVQRRISSNGARFFSFISNLLLSGDDMRWRGEISLVNPSSGSLMPVEAIAGKILSKQGELTWFVTILHDRTEAIEKAKLYDQIKAAAAELEEKVRAATAELVRQNELLRRQALDLEHASMLKSQFLANMSHEYRTPLNAILGYTNLLLQGMMGPLDQQQMEGLRRIDSNAQNLAALIDEILDISRIEAGRMPVRLSTFSLSAMIDDVMAELKPIVTRSNLEVTTRISPAEIAMRSDRQKVKQILLNLLTNALKFTHEGSVKLRATLHSGSKSVSISVTDTGIGIADEDHQRVFEMFHQLDTSPTRAAGGAGLGLAICRRLAEMLNGKITLRSSLGQGSTFTLLLPRSLRKR